jgi:hypothetical protein
MSLWKKVVLAGVAAIGILAWSGVGLAQEEGAAGAAGGGRGARGGRGDPAQMRQRMLERTKEMLGAKDEEWAVISPKLEKVNALRTDIMGGGRGGGRGGEAPQGEETPVRKAAQELRSLLSDSSDGMPVTAEQISAKLTAYREAREKARQELAAAQEELRQVLSVEQEARLVLQGVLD